MTPQKPQIFTCVCCKTGRSYTHETRILLICSIYFSLEVFSISWSVFSQIVETKWTNCDFLVARRLIASIEGWKEIVVKCAYRLRIILQIVSQLSSTRMPEQVCCSKLLIRETSQQCGTSERRKQNCRDCYAIDPQMRRRGQVAEVGTRSLGIGLELLSLDKSSKLIVNTGIAWTFISIVAYVTGYSSNMHFLM